MVTGLGFSLLLSFRRFTFGIGLDVALVGTFVCSGALLVRAWGAQL